MKRIVVAVVLVNLAGGLALGGSGCERSGDRSLRPVEAVEAALRPPALAAAIRKLPGAHWHGTTLFRVTPLPGKSAPDPAAQGVTTTTDLWVDRQGQYRLVESNDQDGGREVVLFGHELAVAIRPGKMIRRAAQEPEPTRVLEEAVGGPWAAWETVRRYLTVDRVKDSGLYRLGRSASAGSLAASLADTSPLRRWRETVAVESLEGEARLDPNGLLVGFTLKARFSATREDKQAISGEIAVASRLDGIGTTPAIAAPQAEALPPRQRTILEERALLGSAPGKESR